ncbi:hypothetical protein [Dyadobacter sp. OTU695]|uniref:hypothetical protein n=1 Tax=Dyadobacter sp. OTU695 TaxID=3043860 RepID=UPI00313EE224
MKTKNLTMIAIMFLMILISSGTYAQNYKQPLPSIDANGKVIDAKGKHIGWVTSDGIIKDATGAKIAHIDDQGSAVDAVTGKKLGKASKNGTYLYHVQSGASDSLTVTIPMNGICEVKDKSGKTLLLVHENYKQYGACAMHCLMIKNEHKDMKMK